MTQAITMIDDNPLDQLIVGRLYERECANSNLVFSDDASTILNGLRYGGAGYPRYPDIILLDLNMPRLSGWDFLKQLNEFYSELIKPVDIYVMSSSVDEYDRNTVLAYPFVKNYFVKPMTSLVFKELQRNYE